MSKKSIFLWSIAVGIALTGGLGSVFSLLVFAALFWGLDKGYDALTAFMNGWRSSADARRDSTKQQPKLTLIRGGKAA